MTNLDSHSFLKTGTFILVCFMIDFYCKGYLDLSVHVSATLDICYVMCLHDKVLPNGGFKVAYMLIHM